MLPAPSYGAPPLTAGYLKQTHWAPFQTSGLRLAAASPGHPSSKTFAKVSDIVYFRPSLAFSAAISATLSRKCCRKHVRCVASFESTEIAGKGVGMVATRDIAEGELILSEAPLLTWASEASTEASPAAALLQEVVTHDVTRQINELSDAKKEQLFSLHDRLAEGGAKSLIGILGTNGFSQPDGHMILCERISRFNHSCCPNCESTFHENIQQKQIYASRAIREGEELCISYIDVRATRSERQELLGMWGFQCACQACGACDLESDARRSRMIMLNPDKGDPASFQDPSSAVESLSELLRLYDEEGLSSQQHRKRACQLLFQFSLQVPDLLVSEKWLKKALEHAALCQAADHHETKLMQETLTTLREKIEIYMPGAAS